MKWPTLQKEWVKLQFFLIHYFFISKKKLKQNLPTHMCKLDHFRIPAKVISQYWNDAAYKKWGNLLKKLAKFIHILGKLDHFIATKKMLTMIKTNVNLINFIMFLNNYI